MNLHIMNDEKVITRAIESFEMALPDNNKFIILKPFEHCRYLKVQNDCIHYIQFGTPEFWSCVGDVKEYKHIILHSLSYNAAKFLTRIEHHSIVWVIWGYDLYNHMLVNKGYRIYDEPWKVLFYSLYKNNIREVRTRLLGKHYYNLIKKVLHKINFASTFPTSDVDILKEYFPEARNIQTKPFFYYPIDQIVGDLENCNIDLGNNIILGHSASFTNNHTKMYNLLAHCNKSKRTIITPLGYGPAKDNALENGYKICGSVFKPIVEFIPLEQYNVILKSAFTFIYGQYRQEAMGNILTALYIGGTVFMFEVNPLFRGLRELGFRIFTIEQLETHIDYRLTDEEKMHNQKLALFFFNKERQLSLIKENFG